MLCHNNYNFLYSKIMDSSLVVKFSSPHKLFSNSISLWNVTGVLFKSGANGLPISLIVSDDVTFKLLGT